LSGVTDVRGHGGSERVRLARVALEAALGTRGVRSAHSGPAGRHATFDGVHRLEGVVCVADADGRYSLDLRLVGSFVPLYPLAERVRARVEERVAGAGLADLLGPVNVRFEDLAETTT
jgi:hypothetical protein